MKMRGSMRRKGMNTTWSICSAGITRQSKTIISVLAGIAPASIIQIGHMISQVMEAWKKLWGKAGLVLAEKHAQILESFRNIRLAEYREEAAKTFQLRFQ